jgi:hypothetical protein
VERGLIAPSTSRLGPLSPEERSALLRASPVGGKYDQALDRDSAYERLAQRATQPAAEPEPATPRSPWGAPRTETRADTPVRGRREPQTITDMVVKSVTRNVAGTIGRRIGDQIVRGILGSILRR